MSHDKEPTGIEQARAARKMAEGEYAASIASRPETIAEVAKAHRLRTKNGLAETLLLAMQARGPA